MTANPRDAIRKQQLWVISGPNRSSHWMRSACCGQLLQDSCLGTLGNYQDTVTEIWTQHNGHRTPLADTGAVH